MRKPGLYRLGLKFAPWMMRIRSWLHRTAIDPAAGWTASRDLPELEARTFRDLLKAHRASRKEPLGGVEKPTSLSKDQKSETVKSTGKKRRK
jgi:hypothetical protein